MHEPLHQSWGLYPRAEHQRAVTVSWRNERLPELAPAQSALPYGLGRSYGDSCLNERGTLLLTRELNRFIAFDDRNGILRCESGVSIAEVLELVVPKGWFIPVSPGTKFVTLGGALANDIHGKNHHRAGTFGCHVRSFELLRSNGDRLVCSPTSNSELFAATIGGLGLTGLVLWVEFSLKKIESPWINFESIKFRRLGEFFDLSAESDRAHEYTVAWVDSLASGRSLGRGIFMRGDHAPRQELGVAPFPSSRSAAVPFYAPEFLLNRASIKTFNGIYYHKQLARKSGSLTHYEPFFYPLDSIGNWNLLYGRRGFFQHQCVVGTREAVGELLQKVVGSGTGSFLTVLKTFSDKSSPGMLSFPRKGYTLALDFPNNGAPTLALLDALDEIVVRSGGAVYPAKDARMLGENFKKFFPKWREFQKHMDPRFSSSFWRRVTA